jgi:integrase
MIDWDAGVIPLAQHKNAKKGKKRTIYLNPPLKKLLRRKASERPAGPLFVTRLGNAWTSAALCWHLRRLEKELKIPKLVTYCWRHTFITDALAKGLTADVVAELVGNSPQSVAKFYSHLESKRDALKAAAARAVG